MQRDVEATLPLTADEKRRRTRTIERKIDPRLQDLTPEQVVARHPIIRVDFGSGQVEDCEPFTQNRQLYAIRPAAGRNGMRDAWQIVNYDNPQYPLISPRIKNITAPSPIAREQERQRLRIITSGTGILETTIHNLQENEYEVTGTNWDPTMNRVQRTAAIRRKISELKHNGDLPDNWLVKVTNPHRGDQSDTAHVFLTAPNGAAYHVPSMVELIDCANAGEREARSLLRQLQDKGLRSMSEYEQCLARMRDDDMASARIPTPLMQRTCRTISQLGVTFQQTHDGPRHESPRIQGGVRIHVKECGMEELQ